MSLESLNQDIAYAIRGLRTKPAFAIAVVTTLALGIGANAAMFGIVDRLLFGRRGCAIRQRPSRLSVSDFPRQGARGERQPIRAICRFQELRTPVFRRHKSSSSATRWVRCCGLARTPWVSASKVGTGGGRDAFDARKEPCTYVVGIAENIKEQSLASDSGFYYYLPACSYS
jgi:hypothetical protein